MTREISDVLTAGVFGISTSRSVVACTRKCANWLTSRGLFGRAVVFVAGFAAFLGAIPQVWHGVLKRLKRKIFQSSPLPKKPVTNPKNIADNNT
ncbi:MAG: hypothetical protein ABSB15_18545 [Bryobacteraceae bacterium]|jgi:hypothetical protein